MEILEYDGRLYEITIWDDDRDRLLAECFQLGESGSHLFTLVRSDSGSIEFDAVFGSVPDGLKARVSQLVEDEI